MTQPEILQTGALVLAESVLLALVVLAFDRWLPARFVRVRHDAALLAIIAVPLLFVAPLVLPSDAAPIVAASIEMSPVTHAAQADAAQRAMQAQVPAVAGEAAAGGFVLPLPLPGAGLMGQTLLFAWAGGVIFLVLRLLGDMRAMGGLVRRARPVTTPANMALSRNVSLRRSAEIAGPMVAGFFRPVILYPEGEPLDASARPVLEHEIAHLRRGDIWVSLLVRIVMSVFWWVAPLYPLDNLLRREREKLCDSEAVSRTGEATALAEALLRVAERHALARHRALVQPPLSMAARGTSGLAQRVTRLADGASVRQGGFSLATAVVPALIALCLVAGPRYGAPEQADGPRSLAESETWIEKMATRDPGNGEREEMLYLAALRGDRSRVITLLEEGHDPSYWLQGDGTPLMAAVRGNHMDILSLLIERGADPNVKAWGDGAALITAARLDRNEMIDALLAAGADPNIAVESDGTPLISAARRGRMEAVEQLLKAGADPDLSIERDGNPLIGAALGNHPRIVERLLDAGANPDGYVFGDETPLINAAHIGSIEVAEQLLDHGADISLTVRALERDGEVWRSPLSEAERTGKTRMVAWLKARGATHNPPAGAGQ